MPTREQSLAKRVERLERELAAMRQPERAVAWARAMRRDQVRLAVTYDDGFYPTSLTANTFPFIFLDATFTQSSGSQAVTASSHASIAQGYARTLDGSYVHAGTLIAVIEYQRRFWAIRNGSLTAAVAKVGASPISARSGTTPGSGTVTIYYLNAGVLTTTGVTVTANNLGSAIAADSYVLIHPDPFGEWWIHAPTAGFNRIRFSLNATLATTDASVSANVETVCNGSLVAVNDTTTVYNHPASANYMFEGASGAIGTAIYDDTNSRWDIIQMECP